MDPVSRLDGHVRPMILLELLLVGRSEKYDLDGIVHVSLYLGSCKGAYFESI